MKLAVYETFLSSKRNVAAQSELTVEPHHLNGKLFDFQQTLTAWALERGCAAIFADTGLGKTAMQLAWADFIVRRTNKNVLILTPIAVSAQTVREGEKFGIECSRSLDGTIVSGARVAITNYERLHRFSPEDFVGIVCDESSILKSFDGARRQQITEFMKRAPYRLLCTATAAPNDYIELGTSSEALGYLGHVDMLNRFFKNDKNNSAQGRMHGKVIQWRFKGHAEVPFWRWVCSWARAIRKPSDLGFADDDFSLPELIERLHIVQPKRPADGMLFCIPAVGLREERDERRRTIEERCQMVAELVSDGDQALVWCHLNPEGDLLERLIPGAVQVSGEDPDDSKEEKLLGFANGEIRVLVTKPKIGAWGLNFQNCAHETFFPSHSFEQYYQGIRRCWRYGQKRNVVIDVVASQGEAEVMRNLQRKAEQASAMFSRIVSLMQEQLNICRPGEFPMKEAIPSWL